MKTLMTVMMAWLYIKKERDMKGGSMKNENERMGRQREASEPRKPLA